ncbi:LOW QUALITY PROTEIN: hypothetical protein HID58_069921, partial [Brassica napus]
SKNRTSYSLAMLFFTYSFLKRSDSHERGSTHIYSTRSVIVYHIWKEKNTTTILSMPNPYTLHADLKVDCCSITAEIPEEARELEKQLRQTLRRYRVELTISDETEEAVFPFDSEMIKLTNVRSSEVGQVMGGGDGPKDNMHGVSSLSSASANLGNNNAKKTPRLTDPALGNLPEVDGFISQNPKLKLSMLLRRFILSCCCRFF